MVKNQNDTLEKMAGFYGPGKVFEVVGLGMLLKRKIDILSNMCHDI